MIQKFPRPRSYIVKTEKSLLRRNRRQLIPSPKEMEETTKPLPIGSISPQRRQDRHRALTVRALLLRLVRLQLSFHLPDLICKLRLTLDRMICFSSLISLTWQWLLIFFKSWDYFWFARFLISKRRIQPYNIVMLFSRKGDMRLLINLSHAEVSYSLESSDTCIVILELNKNLTAIYNTS